jgi:hypothetical protein
VHLLKTIIQVGLIAAASCALAAGGPPTDSLTFISVSSWAGDVPRCSDIGRERTICTWQMPNYEYFTCIVREDAAGLDQEECVFETLANRDHKFVGSVWLLAPIFVLRVPSKNINNL